MARFIPDVHVESITLKPERDVAKALVEQLPSDSIIYHGYGWLHKDQSGLREGETDFIVIVPNLGFIAVEVKGGTLEYDMDNKKWYRITYNRDKPIKDPFEQARNNLHKLKDDIVERAYSREGSPTCGYGYVVVFPDCDYMGSMPPGADSSILFSNKDLPKIGSKLLSALRAWGNGNPDPIDKERMRGFKEVLNGTFQLIPLLSRSLDQDEETLVRLTEEQFRLLDFLDSHERCLIEGVAGSGKTLLAMERAKRYALSGKNVLFVCYNEYLAKWIRRNLSEEFSKSIDVYHFHGLCSAMCRLAKIPFNPSKADDLSDFFEHEAADLLLDAIDVVGSSYDVLIVDEGQDFSKNWWTPLEMLCHDEERAPLYVFYDPAQKLFVDDLGFPDLGRPFPLKENCRNTKKIARLCTNMKELDQHSPDHAPEGLDVERVVCHDSSEFVRTCETILKELKKGGLSGSRIVIQSPFKKSNRRSSVHDVRKMGGYDLVEDLEAWRRDEGVLFTTIRKFKGLEADVVILVDLLGMEECNLSINDLYVAFSRAKHVLHVLVSDENVLPEKWFK